MVMKTWRFWESKEPNFLVKVHFVHCRTPEKKQTNHFKKDELSAVWFVFQGFEVTTFVSGPLVFIFYAPFGLPIIPTVGKNKARVLDANIRTVVHRICRRRTTVLFFFLLCFLLFFHRSSCFWSMRWWISETVRSNKGCQKTSTSTKTSV